MDAAAKQGIGSVIIRPMLYGITGFIGGIITGALYYIVAGWIDGLELELE